MVAIKPACPSCGAENLDVRHYDSMMVLKKDTALFTLTCPKCSAKVSLVHTIPQELADEVLFAADELGAGMGRDR